jgi:hypothetical protein
MTMSHPHLWEMKSRHGKVVWYVCTHRNAPMVRIRGEYGSDDFMAQYHAAVAAKPPLLRKAERESAEVVQKVEACLRVRIQSAKERARKRGLAFDLTLDWLLAAAKAQGFRCAVTGTRFFEKGPVKSQRDVYSPSLDRVDASRGYTTDNVRIVTVAANIMLQDWGEDVLKKIAKDYRTSKSGMMPR